MILEITPEPTPEERAAIEAAVGRLLGESSSDASAWWHAGVSENVEEPDQEE